MISYKKREEEITNIFSVWSFLPTKAFTLVCRSIHKHFGGDDITERQEHLHQLSIPKLLREVVDEQVAALWSCTETDRCTDRGGKEMMGRKKKGLTSERKESGYTAILCNLPFLLLQNCTWVRKIFSFVHLRYQYLKSLQHLHKHCLFISLLFIFPWINPSQECFISTRHRGLKVNLTAVEVNEASHHHSSFQTALSWNYG